MKIHFCGAAGTTTGSQHLLEVNGSRILLDCGMYQGRREEAWHINQGFSVFFSGRCGRGDSFPCAHRPFRKPSQSGEEGVSGKCVQHVRHARPLPDHGGGRRPHPRTRLRIHQQDEPSAAALTNRRCTPRIPSRMPNAACACL